LLAQFLARLRFAGGLNIFGEEKRFKQTQILGSRGDSSRQESRRAAVSS
jgi:hypothetical protein